METAVDTVRDTVIDAHHHLWDPARREYAWLADPALAPIRRAYTAEDLGARAAAVGVGGTVVVQTMSDVAETVDFLGIAAAHSELILGVVGWVDLTSPALADTIAELREGPGGQRLIGIRHQAQDEPDPDWLARPEVIAGLRTIAAARLRYDLLVKPHQLPAAIRAVEQVPEGRFILDHCAKPAIAAGDREPWASRLTALAAYPNVACKLSGLVTEADWQNWQPADIRPYADHVLTAFGPDRVMFGSDWPVCELAADYARVHALATTLCADLTPAERTAVFATTARTWYGL